MPTFTSATGSNLWGPGVNPYLFGTGDKSIYNALIDTEYLVNQLHIKKIGIIYQDDGFGDPSEAATVEVLKSLGLSPTGAEPFDPSATDVTAQLNSLESSGAKAVEAWTYGPGLVAVAKGMESIGWRPPTVTDTGLSQAAVVTGAGPSALTNFYGGPTVKNFLTERAGGQPAAATQTFMKYFRKVFGAGPFDGQQLAASSAYDAVVVLAQAIELAKSTSGPAIKKALEGGHIYIGARTTYRFSKAEHVGEAIVNLGMFKGGIACNLACVVAPGIKLAS
jgi:branched-chain amino acid transport system substrate-binding protein